MAGFDGPVGFPEAHLLDAGEQDGAAHNILLVYEFQGALDVERLVAATRWLGLRHENLRTGFVRVDGQWRRRVEDRGSLELEVIDASSRADPEGFARAAALELAARRFDRAVAPLCVLQLVKLAEGRYWWLSYADHVIVDGVSYAVSLHDLMTAYQAFVEHGAPPSVAPPLQPRDHFAQVEEILAPLRASPDTWRTPDLTDVAPLPVDPSRPGGLDPAGERLPFVLGDPTEIDALARRAGVSRSAPVVAAMGLALRELAARPEVAFTVIRSGRRAPSAQGVLGCLAWGDAFTLRSQPDESVGAALTRADAFLRDDAPWRMLYVPMVAPTAGRVVLNINRYDMSLRVPGIATFVRSDVLPPVRMWHSQDLLVQIFPTPGALFGLLRYRTSMFEAATMARFAENMRRAIATMVADVAAPVASIAKAP